MLGVIFNEGDCSRGRKVGVRGWRSVLNSGEENIALGGGVHGGSDGRPRAPSRDNWLAFGNGSLSSFTGLGLPVMNALLARPAMLYGLCGLAVLKELVCSLIHTLYKTVCSILG